MGQWTWLHTLFPLADIELISDPIDAKTANVIVRTIRRLPDVDTDGEPMYEVRVAPHNVAPFRGGPWLTRFRESDLAEPGDAVYAFRMKLCEVLNEAKKRGKPLV
jgi:hypothetical protein